jgi:peroxidase
VIGSPGTDQLFGGPNNDTLVAAAGNMTMTGGGGADTFVFDPKQHTVATITDWVQGDTLNFGTDVHQIKLKSDGNSGTLVMAGAAHVDLIGVQVSALGQAIAGFSIAPGPSATEATLVQAPGLSAQFIQTLAVHT